MKLVSSLLLKTLFGLNHAGQQAVAQETVRILEAQLVLELILFIPVSRDRHIPHPVRFRRDYTYLHPL